MQISHKSPVFDMVHTMDLPITEEREFLKIGITPEEWDDLFGGEDAQ